MKLTSTKRETYVSPLCETEILQGEQVLCVSAGNQDWIVDPGELNL